MSNQENVTQLPGSGPDSTDAAIAERARKVLNPVLSGLGSFIHRGATRDVYREAIDDATTIAEVISALDTKSDELADRAVPELAFLQRRILDTAKAVHDYEADKRREGSSDD